MVLARLSATVVDSMWHGASGRALAEGWRIHEAETDEVDLDTYFPSAGSLPLRIAGRLTHRFAHSAFNAAVASTVARAGSDVMLTVKGNALTPETLARVRAAGASSVIYYPDYHFDHATLDMAVIEGADLVCTTKSFQMDFLDKLRGKGRSVFIHHGYSPAAHRPRLPDLDEADYRWDICYAGNCDAYKSARLLAVAKAFPQAKIIVAGYGWTQAAQGTALAPFVHGGPITGDRLATLHQLSRINLGIQSGAHARTGWRDLVSTRTFEIPASKGFMLHEDNQELRSLFALPEEVDAFDGTDDLLDKIRFYLGRPDLRRSMIAAAYARAVPAYSYHARARDIAAAVREVRPAR